MSKKSFVSMVVDIANVKYPNMLEIYKKLTGEEFSAGGSVVVDKPSGCMGDCDDNIVDDVVEVDYFDGINVDYRDKVLPNGYGVVYDPASIKTVAVQESYLVSAIVTHKESGDTHRYDFVETAYPVVQTHDKYGREFYDMSDVSDSECKTIKLRENKRFVKPKDDDEDVIVMSAYQEVLGRAYVGSEGLEYWVQELKSKGWDDDTLKLAIANASLEDNLCVLASSKARDWLEVNYPNFSKEVSVTSRVKYFLPDGYSITFEPADVKREYELSSYVVNATVVNNSNGEKKLYTFNEASIVIDVFDGVDVFNRTNTPSDAVYDVEFAPADKKSRTIDTQVYDVKAKVTHKLSGKSKVFTFSETIQAKEAEYSADGRFKLYFDEELPSDDECIKAQGLSGGYIRIDTTDTTQKMVAKAYKDVLGREYIGSAGFAYWYDETIRVGYTQAVLNETIAFGALGHGGCSVMVAKAKNYLKSVGFSIDNTGVYKDETNYVKIANAWSERVIDRASYTENYTENCVMRCYWWAGGVSEWSGCGQSHTDTWGDATKTNYQGECPDSPKTVKVSKTRTIPATYKTINHAAVYEWQTSKKYSYRF